MNDIEALNKKYERVEFYILKDWDGADGTSNRANGFITRHKHVAEDWRRTHVGASYTNYSGVLIDSISEMKDAQIELDRARALAKLSTHERQLLGLE